MTVEEFNKLSKEEKKEAILNIIDGSAYTPLNNEERLSLKQILKENSGIIDEIKKDGEEATKPRHWSYYYNSDNKKN